MKATAIFLGGWFLLLALPVQAQHSGHHGGRVSLHGSFSGHRFHSASPSILGSHRHGTFATGRPSFPTHVFRGHGGLGHRDFHHGFGFQFGFPVFGLGFDAHHFAVLQPHHMFPHHVFPHHVFVSPFFFPFTSMVSSTVVVVPQTVPVQLPIVVTAGAPVGTGGVPVGGSSMQPAQGLVGTPRAEERIQVVQPSLAAEQPVSSRLTLLVFKDHSIHAATDYWLEDGRVHYAISYGVRNAVPLDEIDLEMTAQLNRERGVEFVLRPKPPTQ